MTEQYQNPYAAPDPAGDTSVDFGPEAENQVTPRMVSLLRATRPWVLLLSIIGFISCGFMLIGSLAIIAVSAVGAELQDDEFGALGPVVMGVIYLLMGLIYLIPSVYLYRYSSSINRLRYAPGSRNLESVIDSQRSFWKCVGILTLMGIGLSVILFIAIIAVTASNVSRM